MEKNCISEDFLAKSVKNNSSSPRNLIDFGLRVCLAERVRIYRIREAPSYLVRSNTMRKLLMDILAALLTVNGPERDFFKQSEEKLRMLLSPVFDLLASDSELLSEQDSEQVFSHLREIRSSLRSWFVIDSGKDMRGGKSLKGINQRTGL